MPEIGGQMPEIGGQHLRYHFHAPSTCVPSGSDRLKLPPQMEPGRSTSTVGQSRESLDRGASILLGIAKHGVVKKEDDGDEQEILKQIEARYTTPLEKQATHTFAQALKKKHALLQEAKASPGLHDVLQFLWIHLDSRPTLNPI